MTAYQPRSRRPHHNDQTRRTAANGSFDGATSLDAIDVATCRVRLTADGWYIDAVDPETSADPRAAVRAAAHRRDSRQERPASFVVIAVVPQHHDRDSQYAVQAVADVIRSAVRSRLDSHDLQIELTVVSPGAGGNG
jgi:hypothetical protein